MPERSERHGYNDEDIDSLLISERYDAVLNDLRAEQQQELTPVIAAVVQKPVDSILLKGGVAGAGVEISPQVLAHKDQRDEKLQQIFARKALLFEKV